MNQKLKAMEKYLGLCISGLEVPFLRQLMRATPLALCLMTMSSVTVHAQSNTYVVNTDNDTLSLIYTATHEIKNPPVRAIIELRRPADISASKKYNPVATAITPYSVAGNSTGQFVYTVNKDDNSVSVVDAVKAKFIARIPVGLQPVAIAISGVRLDPVGGGCRPSNPLWRTYAYVTNFGGNSVSIIDTDPEHDGRPGQPNTWNTVVKTLTFANGIGTGPSAVAVSKPTLEQATGNGMFFAGGFYVFVTNSTDSTVSVIGGDYRRGANGCATTGADEANFHKVIDQDPVTAGVQPLDLKLAPPGGGRPGLHPAAISFDRYGRWAYVANIDSDNVTAIDACYGVAETQGTCTNPFVPNLKVVRGIELNQGVGAPARNGAKPAGIAVTIDFTGTRNHQNLRGYVPNSGDDSYSVINLEASPTNPLFQTTVFVCDQSAVNPQACPKAGDKPTGVSVLYPDEDFVYITNYGSNSVSVVDSDPDSLGGPGGVAQYNHIVGRINRGIGVPMTTGAVNCQPPEVGVNRWCGRPLGIANTPRIPYAYVMNSGTKTISVVGASPQIQEPPDPHPVLHTIKVPWSPTWVTLNRNQDFIFVADKVGKKVHVINTMAQLEVGATTANIGSPLRLATPPDGWSTYVTSDNGSIYAVDTVDRSGPGGPGDPFQAGGADDVSFPIPGTPGFAPIILRLRQCPTGDPLVCAAPGGGSGGGGSNNGTVGQGGTGGNQGNGPPPAANRARIQVGVGATLGGLDVHPDTFVGLVASKGADEVVMFDTHYDRATWNKVLGRVALPVGSGPLAVAFTHVGSRALVMNSNNTVSLINTSGNTYSYLSSIAVGNGPQAMAFSENDQFAYVVNSLDQVGPGLNGTVSVIRLSDFTEVVRIPVGKNPQDIFVNLGERSAAYVTNKDDATVSIIDVLNHSPGFNTVRETVSLVDVRTCNPATAACPREAAPIGLIITEP